MAIRVNAHVRDEGVPQPGAMTRIGPTGAARREGLVRGLRSSRVGLGCRRERVPEWGKRRYAQGEPGFVPGVGVV